MRKLVFFLSFFVLTKFTIDPDLGWHLAMGQRFLSTGEIMRTDDFSWTMSGFSWSHSYFGYQVLVAFLFEHVGFFLIGILFGLLVAFGIFLLLPKKLSWLGLGVVVIGLAIMSGNIGIRPHVFDLVFVAILFKMLEARLHFNPRVLPFWFLLFVVWANIHVGFMFGLLFLGTFCVCDYLFLKKKTIKKLTILSLVILVSFLGTFINPFYYLVWLALFELSGANTAWFYLLELQPITASFVVTLFYLVSGVFLIFMFKRAKNIEPVWLLTAALVFMLPFLTIFFAFFWAALFIFLGTRYLLNFQSPKFLKSRIIAFCATCAVLVIVLAFLANILESSSFERRLRRDGYPVDAIKFMRTEGIGQNLYNRYGWGGFLDLVMPETKVFIDGRMAGWKGKEMSIFDDYIDIDYGRNCNLVLQYEIESVLVKVDDIGCFSDFKVVWEDELSRVLIRQ